MTAYGVLKEKEKFLKEGFRQVHTGPGNPGKSWNFILTFSRTFKLKKKEEKDYRSWKSALQLQ